MKTRRQTMTALVALVLAAPAVTTFAQQTPSDLLPALRAGGLVIVMRHASSPRDVPSKETATPGNTKPERQLDEAGRASATAMGAALRQAGIRITSVLSSGTFRALQTVRLAGLGEPTIVNELGDGGQSMQATTDAQSAWLRARVTQIPSGGNVLLVTHMPNISRAFPDWGTLADGESVVLRPDGKAFTVIGRVPIEAWPMLAAAAPGAPKSR
jgi:phosphohistidine phosphatase SixA